MSVGTHRKGAIAMRPLMMRRRPHQPTLVEARLELGSFAEVLVTFAGCFGADNRPISAG